jgi:hypothetical protein
MRHWECSEDRRGRIGGSSNLNFCVIHRMDGISKISNNYFLVLEILLSAGILTKDSNMNK